MKGGRVVTRLVGSGVHVGVSGSSGDSFTISVMLCKGENHQYGEKKYGRKNPAPIRVGGLLIYTAGSPLAFPGDPGGPSVHQGQDDVLGIRGEGPPEIKDRPFDAILSEIAIAWRAARRSKGVFK